MSHLAGLQDVSRTRFDAKTRDFFVVAEDNLSRLAIEQALSEASKQENKRFSISLYIEEIFSR